MKKLIGLNIFKILILSFLLSFPALALNYDVLEKYTQEFMEYKLVGDMEGVGEHFETLRKNGIIKWDETQQRWDLVSPDKAIVINGDLMRRGPVGMRLIEWVLDLRSRYPGKVFLQIGNHDGNILSKSILTSRYVLGNDQRFNAWLAETGLPNSEFSRMFFWAKTQGITEKLLNAWAEMILLENFKMPKDRLQVPPGLMAHLTTNGKLDVEKLSRYLSADDFAKRFNDFTNSYGKNNLAWKYLEQAKIDRTIIGKKKNGELAKNDLGWPVVIEAFHSGMSNVDSFGVIPGVGRYISVGNHKSTVQNIEYEGIKLDPANPAHAPYLFLAWQRDYNEVFKTPALKEYQGVQTEISKAVKAFETSTDSKNKAELAKTIEVLIGKLGQIELIKQLDAVWNEELKSLYYRTDSRVYPNPNLISENALPAIPENDVVAAEAKAMISVIAGGHKPVGDMSAIMLAWDEITKRNVVRIFHDTSYSPVEGNNDATIKGDGTVVIRGVTKNGILIHTEYPGPKLMHEWTEIAKQYAGVKNIESIENEEHREIVKRMDRYSRLGKVAGGRLILGFKSKIDAHGKWNVDFDTYVSVQQESYKFSYQEIDIWGILDYEKENGKLEYASKNIETQRLASVEKKRKDISDLGKISISEFDFLRLVRNKTVIPLSGAAEGSMAQVYGDPQGKENLQRYLQAFKQELLNIPLAEEIVFITGGTTGLERRQSEIINQVNSLRKLESERLNIKFRPLETIGSLTLVAGKGELDPYIDKFLVLDHAFYWNDFYPELIKLLKISKAKEIIFRITGGGPIVGNQINSVIEAASKDPRMKLALFKGISIDPNNISADTAIKKKRGAADKKIEELLAKRQTGKYSFLTAITLDEGNFKSMFGPDLELKRRSKTRNLIIKNQCLVVYQ
jgi:hypothetical protein